jgi:hypothetical protein
MMTFRRTLANYRHVFFLTALLTLTAATAQGQDCRSGYCSHRYTQCLATCGQINCGQFCGGQERVCLANFPTSFSLNVWRPQVGGALYRLRLAHFNWLLQLAVTEQQELLMYWGSPGDIPLFGNYIDGSYPLHFNVWRPSNGTWYHSPTIAPGFSFGATKQFGLPGDVPVPENFNYRVWRPSSGVWYSQQTDGCLNGSAQFPVSATQWGLSGDFPVPGRYKFAGPITGEPPATDASLLAVYRPANGGWYFRNDEQSQAGNQSALHFKQWGLSGDHPMPGDYDGDGFLDIAVWRPANGTWYICNSSTDYDCSTPRIVQFGLPNDMPMSIDFDADSRRDIAVWRPSIGNWYILQSTTNEVFIRNWGLRGDVPLPIGVRDRTRFSYRTR